MLKDDQGDYVLKDPSANLDYPFDWTKWLDKVADTIATHTVTFDPGGELSASSTVGTAKVITAWLTGGVLNKTYKVTCRIVTNNVPPRTDERTMRVKMRQR